MKTKKIYWSEQSFTGLGPEDRCSSRGMGTPIIIKKKTSEKRCKENSPSARLKTVLFIHLL